MDGNLGVGILGRVVEVGICLVLLLFGMVGLVLFESHFFHIHNAFNFLFGKLFLRIAAKIMNIFLAVPGRLLAFRSDDVCFRN